MWDLSWKKVLITLGLSVVIWYMSVVIQGITSFNAPYNTLFTASSCKMTGFPIVKCISPGPGEISIWLINMINIFFWFWVIHLFWGWFNKQKF